MADRQDQVLGRRRLQVVGGPRRRYVTVTFSQPRRVGRQAWACSVRVTGAGLRVADEPTGGDALHAVQLALEHVRHVVDASGLALSWGDAAEVRRMVGGGWTGFPRVVPPFFGPEGAACAARVDRYIDQQARVALRALRGRAKAKYEATTGEPWPAALAAAFDADDAGAETR